MDTRTTMRTARATITETIRNAPMGTRTKRLMITRHTRTVRATIMATIRSARTGMRTTKRMTTPHTLMAKTMTTTTVMRIAELTALLHLASPALPIGAFSYSQGLQSAIEHGLIHDGDSARR